MENESIQNYGGYAFWQDNIWRTEHGNPKPELNTTRVHHFYFYIFCWKMNRLMGLLSKEPWNRFLYAVLRLISFFTSDFFYYWKFATTKKNSGIKKNTKLLLFYMIIIWKHTESENIQWWQILLCNPAFLCVNFFIHTVCRAERCKMIISHSLKKYSRQQTSPQPTQT